MVRKHLSFAFVTLVVASSAVAACAGDGDEGQLTIGVQAEPLGGAIDQVHLVARVGDAVQRDEVVPVTASDPFVREIALRGPMGAKASVVVEGLADHVPTLTRHAESALVGTNQLLRVVLEPICLAPAPTFVGSSNVGGAGPTLTCDAASTCIGGQCQPSWVPESDLEAYSPSWASAPPDFCRPKNAGAPEVIVGTGQTDYAQLNDDQIVALERGPQGGHHVWVATRMKNLRRSGSITTLSARLPDLPDLVISDAAYVFSFDRDEGGYCKLYGLRYQLDANMDKPSEVVRRFLGQRLELTVTVTDSTGASARATRMIRIADHLLCPDGTSGCE